MPQNRQQKKTLPAVLRRQRSEITEHYVYQKLARISADGKNKETLNRIANDELKHNFYFHFLHFSR